MNMVSPALASAPAKRLLSLDVLRGITIAFMIMVNNNGGPSSWSFMNHAEWNGLTPTDLVFPTFIFIVGTSVVFAVESRLAHGVTRRTIAWHTLQRACILFLLGVVVNGFPSFALAHLRIYGVLQRIAICYLAVGLFYLWDKRVWTKVVALAVLLIGYWILMRWVSVPGAGMPGRDIPFLDKSMNLTAWLDRHIFPSHLYEDWVTHNLYDPEGLLSNLPAVGTALLGLLAGIWLRGRRTPSAKAKGLIVATITCLASGYLWSIWFPLNKNLWTSSYVLVAAGWSLAVLTLAYWAMELRGWGKGRSWSWPWLVFGSNAIVAYMFSELLSSAMKNIHFIANGRHTDAFSYVLACSAVSISNPGWAAFAYSVFFLVVCFIPVWILYCKKIFVKI